MTIRSLSPLLLSSASSPRVANRLELEENDRVLICTGHLFRGEISSKEAESLLKRGQAMERGEGATRPNRATSNTQDEQQQEQYNPIQRTQNILIDR